MRIFGDTGALCVEALVGVWGVVDELEFSVVIEEAVASFDEPVLVPLLVAELAVVPVRKNGTEMKTHVASGRDPLGF